MGQYACWLGEEKVANFREHCVHAVLEPVKTQTFHCISDISSKMSKKIVKEVICRNLNEESCSSAIIRYDC